MSYDIIERKNGFDTIYFIVTTLLKTFTTIFVANNHEKWVLFASS